MKGFNTPHMNLSKKVGTWCIYFKPQAVTCELSKCSKIWIDLFVRFRVVF